MTRAQFFAAAFAICPNVALAETIELSRPVIGASLDKSGIDMVVYYIDCNDHFEVVATFAAKAEPEIAKRIRLGLCDGDTIGFDLPGDRRVSYAFSRKGDTVRVTAKPYRRNITQFAFRGESQS